VLPVNIKQERRRKPKKNKPCWCGVTAICTVLKMTREPRRLCKKHLEIYINKDVDHSTLFRKASEL